MTAFANFRAMAKGMGQPVVQKHTLLPDSGSPGVSVTTVFGFQSYYDNAGLQNALQQQSQNELIVNNSVSPAQQINIPGYTFGLHPSSQTPVAVQPLVAGQTTSPQPIVLRPGQIYRPHGRPWGVSGNFSGLNWGLPFGWLGGGLATLYVFPSPDADVAWPGDAEVLFHRQRMLIADPAAPPANAPKNWPLRFPWTQAVRVGTISQKGLPTIAISRPTKILMSLRLNTLAAPATVRFDIQSSNDFDLDINNAVIATPVRFIDYTWGSYAPSGAAGNFANEFPVVEAPTELVRLAADDGGVQLFDTSGGSLVGAYIDIARYGMI
jgi:hypothetical protein